MLELCRPFELSQAECDQSASLEEKEAGATARVYLWQKKKKQEATANTNNCSVDVLSRLDNVTSPKKSAG